MQGLLLLTILLLLGASGLGAKGVREHDVKAAFLLNFARFVEWPPEAFGSAQAPFVIGIVGEDPFGEAIETTILQQQVKGRTIRLRHCEEDADFGDCHILFVSRSVGARVEKLLERLKGLPVLTVGETDAFVLKGGGIGFLIKDGNVRFDVNAKVAKATGLKFSSKLLAVARLVHDAP